MNPKFKPSKAFFKYLKGEYAYAVHGYRTTLSDTTLADLLASAYGITAWIHTKTGVRWLFNLYGIEELSPHFAYQYLRVEPTLGTKSIIPASEITIFATTGVKSTDLLKSTFDIAKKVIYAEGWKIPEERVLKRALGSYRDWLQTTEGKNWAKDEFAPIYNIIRFGGTTYKLKKQAGNILWTGGNQVQIQTEEYKWCEGCDLNYPCTDEYTNLGVLCNRCYAENFADPETLGACCRFECKIEECGHYLSHFKYKSLVEEIRTLPIQWEEQSEHG